MIFRILKHVILVKGGAISMKPSKSRWQYVLMLGLVCFFAFPLNAQKNRPLATDQSPWSFLSTSASRAYEFLKAHPTYNGRGVVIIICDSGVDMGIPGLLQTSTGETKVIDAQDFSGQGDVPLEKGELKSENNQKFIESVLGLRLKNYDKLSLKPVDGKYWIGVFDEERFQNSRVEDINNNGAIDDNFGVLAFKVKEGEEEYWVAYVDTDGDGYIDNEKPLRDYKVKYDTFKFRGGEAEEVDLMTFALNIHPEDKVVSIHFADNPHATHVAGIAAGYRINDQEGLNGIAPGAKIISCKIGNGGLAGASTTTGSMKKAIEYGVNWAKKHPELAVVFNISYGIGSELEGRSEIDRFIDRTLKENEDLVICISNGNEGPGVSTTGTPAASFWAISSGALMPWESARDTYGATLGHDVILPFSSRGGELMKPDLISPGAAMSTVPQYMHYENFWGTSMASPQTAGAVALLLSGAKQENLLIKGALIKRALKYSADELPKYTALDQGNGRVNVVKAFELLREYSRRKEAKQLLDYKITTISPVYPDEEGQTAYWRTNGYFPSEGERQKFIVKAIFPKDKKREEIKRFFRAFNLKATAPWLLLDKRSTYIKADQNAVIPVAYDKTKLTKPGLYVAKVLAYRKTGKGLLPRKAPSNIEFELWNTIIIPYRFDAANRYQQRFSNVKIAPGVVDRYFLLVPPGASGAEIILKPSSNKWCHVRPTLFDPAGHTYATGFYADSKRENIINLTIKSKDISPGIWELDIISDFRNEVTSFYDLRIRFSGFSVEPKTIETINFNLGEVPEGEFFITNLFSEPFIGTVRGTVCGYQKHTHKQVRSDIWTYSFKVGKEIEKVVFDIHMPAESFNLFTDIATNILDATETVVINDGLTYGKKTLTLWNPEPGRYTLKIIAAYTNYELKEKWKFDLTESYYLKDKISISVTKNGSSSFTLYPATKTKLNYTLSKSLTMPPAGYVIFGQIDFRNRYTGNVVSSVPVQFKLGLK